MKKKINISVVCATHNGSRKIKNLIYSIKDNYVYPKEIVICGTNALDLKYIPKNLIKKLNIKFILSKKKSQIIQRNIAIKNSKSDFILQIDDDVVIKKNFFINLSKYTSSNNDKKMIVSALIIQNNKSLQAGTWNNIYKRYGLFRFLVLILNKFNTIKEYSILSSGRCVPYIKNFDKKLKNNIENVEWLCSTILYHKDCLKYVRNFKQRSNKAYYEDVLFSHQLYRKNYKLLIDVNAIGIHDNQPYTSTSIYFKTLLTQLDLVRFFNKSKILFILDVFIFTFIHMFRDFYVKINEKN